MFLPFFSKKSARFSRKGTTQTVSRTPIQRYSAMESVIADGSMKCHWWLRGMFMRRYQVLPIVKNL